MQTKTLFALLAAAYTPSVLGCLHFNGTLTQGPTHAYNAKEGVDIANQQLSGSNIQTNDKRLTVYLWDDVNNNNIPEPLVDNFCSGEDLIPYKEDTWTVPCTPKEKQVELDVYFNEDIVPGGVLVDVFTYKNPRFQSEHTGDPNRKLVFTFQAQSPDGEGGFYETTFACGDCKDSTGATVKCGNTAPGLESRPLNAGKNE